MSGLSQRSKISSKKAKSSRSSLMMLMSGNCDFKVTLVSGFCPCVILTTNSPPAKRLGCVCSLEITEVNLEFELGDQFSMSSIRWYDFSLVVFSCFSSYFFTITNWLVSSRFSLSSTGRYLQNNVNRVLS